tara:strand:+ start:3274 stop:3975 length:702 start_codon:yes stop_codon:yes gene_type:complete
MSETLVINKKEIKKGILNNICRTWNAAFFEEIINNGVFDSILDKLVMQVNDNKRFTPPIKDLFNTFKYCPYDDAKVFIIGQDPYPQFGVADGIAFSCSKTGKLQPSLRYIFKEINGSQWDSLDPDLKRWCAQGVCLINTAFTVEIGKIGSHYDIWKQFTKELLTHLNNRDHKQIFILLGKKAEQWEKYIDKQKIYKLSHPASAAYRGGVWDSKNIFNKVNEDLKNMNLSQINW